LVTNLAPSSLTNVNGTLFFAADDGIHGQELWKLVDDPTAATSLAVSGFPATITAGVAGSFTATAKNADGTTNAGYPGVVHFTSTAPPPPPPATSLSPPAARAAHPSSPPPKPAGAHPPPPRDPLAPGRTGTQAATPVKAAAPSRFAVAGFPSPVTA